MKKVLAIDLDGTLLYPRNILRFVPKRNIRFLREYIDGGGMVVLITARGLKFAKKVVRQIDRPIDIIGGNGTIIIKDDAIIKSDYLDNKLVAEIINDFNTNYRKAGQTVYLSTPDCGLIIDSKTANFITIAGTLLWFKSYIWNSESIIISHKKYINTLKNGIITKIVFFNGLKTVKRNDGARVVDEFLKKYPTIEGSWSDYVSEFTPLHSQKSEALAFYAKTSGLTKEDFVVVGDSGNDIPMFEAFPHSFAMSHGPLHVKQSASFIIDYVCDLAKYKDLLEGESE